MRDPPVKRPPITDSPWYWLYLFATGGVIALVVMGPRYSARQAQIERKYQGRQRAAQRLQGGESSTTLSSPEKTAVKLWPLYVVMAGLLCFAWARLAWTHYRGRPAARGAGSGDSPPA